MSVQEYGRVPFIPEKTLKKHKVFDTADDRYRSAQRLRQALYREQHSWPIGSYTTAKGKKRKMGNYLCEKAAAAGANFVTPEIAKLVRKEIAYREDGALVDVARVKTNMVSSHPATFNLLGQLKLEPQLGSSVLRMIAPDYAQTVTEVLFEHSPSRRDPIYTNCRSAFDALFKCTTVRGESGFVATEVKLTENMLEQPAALRPRFDELSRLSGLYNDPDHPALRTNPLQQFWRQHMLAAAMVMNGLYTSGRFIVIAPRFNSHVQEAAHQYQQHLAGHDGAIEFDFVSFEQVIQCIAIAGAEELAEALYARYCSFDALDELI